MTFSIVVLSSSLQVTTITSFKEFKVHQAGDVFVYEIVAKLDEDNPPDMLNNISFHTDACA
jgi:hypothetical protein